MKTPAARAGRSSERGIHSALSEGYGKPLDVESEYLNRVRHDAPEYVGSWIEFLPAKYAADPPDLIIPVSVQALQLTRERHASHFPKTSNKGCEFIRTNVSRVAFCSAKVAFSRNSFAERKATLINSQPSSEMHLAGKHACVTRAFSAPRAIQQYGKP